MGRLLPRSRPRKKSADFSRLWWLVATEAAYRVLTDPSTGKIPPWWRHRALMAWRPGFQQLRARARAVLANYEVIL